MSMGWGPFGQVPHRITPVEGQNAVWLTADNCFRQEVAGESYNPEHVAWVVRASGLGVELIAWLAPEPANPHDPNAVMIWIRGGRVGYLPRIDAIYWHQPIVDLERHFRMRVACAAHAELPPETDPDQPFQIVLWLPDVPWWPRQRGIPRHERARVMLAAAAEPEARAARAREREAEAARRREELIAKFGAEDAARIERKTIWIGETEEMLRLSLGPPADFEQKVLKTKSKATFKYGHQGANRYRLRVFLENGIVVGWEEK